MSIIPGQKPGVQNSANHTALAFSSNGGLRMGDSTGSVMRSRECYKKSNTQCCAALRRSL